MIRIELEDFTIDVPVERRMTVAQFLAIADKLERISNRAHAPHTALPSGEPAPQSSEPIYDTHPAIEHGGYHDVPSHVHHAHAPVTSDPMHVEGLRFDHEERERIEYFVDRLSRQLHVVEELQSRLERLERTIIENSLPRS